MTGSLDVKKRSPKKKMIGFLCEPEAGKPVKDLCRPTGFSEAPY